MLSSRFAVSIRPERRLRRLIASWAWLSATGGLLLILLLPAPGVLTCLLAIGWLISSAPDLRAVAIGRADVHELRFRGNDPARALFDNGIWRPIELQPGCWIGSGVLWLRFSTDTGGVRSVAIRRAACRAEDWRRLQVILRFRAA